MTLIMGQVVPVWGQGLGGECLFLYLSIFGKPKAILLKRPKTHTNQESKRYFNVILIALIMWWPGPRYLTTTDSKNSKEKTEPR